MSEPVITMGWIFRFSLSAMIFAPPLNGKSSFECERVPSGKIASTPPLFDAVLRVFYELDERAFIFALD